MNTGWNTAWFKSRRYASPSAYRELCIACNDNRPLAGFDEKQYVEFANFESRLWWS